MELPSSNRLKREHEVKDERPFWKAVVQGISSGLVRYSAMNGHGIIWPLEFQTGFNRCSTF
jgi:nucleoside diphosphate kinase